MDRLAAASGTAEEAEEIYRRKRAEEQAARCRMEEGPDLVNCRQSLGDWKSLAGLEEESAELQRAAQRAETDAENARKAHDVARAAVDATFETLDRVRSVKRAESLVAQLREGEPCPVCRQTVTNLPDHDIDAELAELEAAHNEARSALAGC